jgi:mRNA-degrading endonuclease RelE of RelBE toxin-antitoxin system
MAEVKITDRCREKDIPPLPRDVLATFIDRLETLAANPEHGKPLQADLKRYRSVRLGRYRIIHRYDQTNDIVWVVAVGIRKEGSKEDIYERVTKLLDSGDLIPE